MAQLILKLNIAYSQTSHGLPLMKIAAENGNKLYFEDFVVWYYNSIFLSECETNLQAKKVLRNDVVSDAQFKFSGITEWMSYVQKRDLNPYDAEDIRAEIKYAFESWREVIGSESTTVHSTSPLMRKLITKMGITFCPELHGMALQKIAEANDGEINVDSFASWYLSWLNDAESDANTVLASFDEE